MKIYHVDAFTDKMFSGNPAGVCVLPATMPDAWLQGLANELNLSETAFLHDRGIGFGLRWFTPTREVDLCGHATLASAHILWESGILNKRETARFETKSGLLTASKSGELIEMDFPAENEKTVDPPDGLMEGLGVRVQYVGRNRMDYLVEVDSEKTVRDLQPDMESLRKINTRGIIVTSRSGAKEYDFVSRFFAPTLGIAEDPVTGSAHCCLGPYWGEKLGKQELIAYQASKRGGTVKARVEDDRVILGGRAVTVFDAELRIDREEIR